MQLRKSSETDAASRSAINSDAVCRYSAIKRSTKPGRPFRCIRDKLCEYIRVKCRVNSDSEMGRFFRSQCRSLQAYTEWMKGLLTFMPDGRYVVKSFATDGERKSVCAYGVFSATHTGEGGPCPPTGKSTSTDYVYVMEFDGDKIRHMTKIWNAGWAMRELGWA
jgi:predicted ester cyclase